MPASIPAGVGSCAVAFFDVTVNGTTHERVGLRGGILVAIKAAVAAGSTPPSLAPFVTQPWAVFDGNLNSDAMKAQIPADRHRRYFIDDDELFHVGGKTYALTNQWSQPEWETALKAISYKHPALGLSWRYHGAPVAAQTSPPTIEKTFVLFASPGPWGGPEIEQQVALHRSGEDIAFTWHVPTTSALRAGDQLVWLHVAEPQGVVATGHVATIKGDTEIVALIDEIVVAQPEKLLARSALDDTLHETIWSHPGPSEELTEADAVAVEERWQAHLAESGAGPLRLVSSVEQLRHSLISFVRAVTVRSGLAERSVSQPDNWVFESETERFAPSKWCAFRGMTPVRYEALLAVQKTRGSVRGFDGHRTKRHLEKLFSRAFTSDATLSDVLQKWLKTSYGKGSSSSAVKFLSTANAESTPQPTLQEASSMPSDLNLIYYGPPGTGKTFTTASKAVEIIDGTAPSDRVELMSRYRALRNEGLIEFVTFHQSYSYEEFVEGIRPILDDEDDEAGAIIRYECKPGVFSRFCADAEGGATSGAATDFDLNAATIWKMSLGNTKRAQESDIYDQCIENDGVLLGYGRGLNYDGCDTWEAVFEKLRGEKPDIKDNDYNIDAVHRFKNEMQVGDLIVVSDGNHKFRAIARVTGSYKYLGPQEYGQSRPVEWLFVAKESLPREGVVNRQFSQQTIYKLSKSALHLEKLRALLTRTAVHANRVLIIDEINRGNIAKIMGELITLIEPDKRRGAVNELRVTLPYSGTEFTVPAHLYIIGTMNTADRSIALLDSALRRRFRFIEMEPDPDILKTTVGQGGVIDGVDVAALLRTLNDRIELLHDRDRALGHAYFIGCVSLDDLRDAVVHRVLPLLQEYFHEHWERICMVLGCPHDDAGKCTSNAHPIIRARLLRASQLLGPSTDFDDCLRYEVHQGFATASGPALVPFFAGLMSTKDTGASNS